MVTRPRMGVRLPSLALSLLLTLMQTLDQRAVRVTKPTGGASKSSEIMFSVVDALASSSSANRPACADCAQISATEPKKVKARSDFI